MVIYLATTRIHEIQHMYFVQRCITNNGQVVCLIPTVCTYIYGSTTRVLHADYNGQLESF